MKKTDKLKNFIKDLQKLIREKGRTSFIEIDKIEQLFVNYNISYKDLI